MIADKFARDGTPRSAWLAHRAARKVRRAIPAAPPEALAAAIARLPSFTTTLSDPAPADRGDVTWPPPGGAAARVRCAKVWTWDDVLAAAKAHRKAVAAERLTGRPAEDDPQPVGLRARKLERLGRKRRG